MNDTMRFALVPVAAVALSASPADAVRDAPDSSVARQSTKAPRLRTHRAVIWDRTPAAGRAAWDAFVADHPGRWRAAWDAATAVPTRIFGAGVRAPGTIASPGAAESFALRFLARHIDLLAPGATIEDFAVVSNRVDDGLRTVGLAQRHDGMRVVGGQVSFRFKNDRMFVIGSEALPHIAVTGGRTVSAQRARHAAARFVGAAAPSSASFTATSVDGPVVLPLVGPDRIHGYERALRVDVAARGAPGRWNVYVGAASGEALVRERTVHYGTASIQFEAPVRRPGGERTDDPARLARVTVGHETLHSDHEGAIRWEGDGQARVTARSSGMHVQVVNDRGDEAMLADFVAPSERLVWDARDDEMIDAQVSAFIHAGIAKEFARSLTDDEWLDEPLQANVNIDDHCNAFFDQASMTINFFTANSDCANTARLADVVYHEFGHALHVRSIVDGVGQFDSAFSEGLSDYFATAITGDPAMGRGFFRDDKPLRHIDPPDREHTWPEDVGEVHTTGLIFAGAMWDLRERLIEKYGTAEGADLANQLFLAAVKRSVGIPSSYVEVLAADDDDGNLSNGTPNVCAINSAFGTHGLRAVQVELDRLGAEPVTDDGHRLSLRVRGLYDGCPDDRVETAEVAWHPRNEPDAGGTIEMTRIGEGFEAMIPPQGHGSVVRYRVHVTFADGGDINLPTNRADGEYEFYVGELVPLYCTDFETDPFEEGWTHGRGDPACIDRGDCDETDDWAWGAPAGDGGDPPAAHSGQRVIGNDLGGDSDGRYQPDRHNFLVSPVIDVGSYSDVRLQYHRWLDVEDAYYDQASIFANGNVAWRNLNSNTGIGSNTHHRDSQWRFHDVALTPVVGAKPMRVRFDLSSDGGLEFGGWTIDDVCVVADPQSICGDGEITGAEVCDDGEGNSDAEPDACRMSCRPAMCGDGVVDSEEACDDGNTLPGDTCNAVCELPVEPSGCGCRATGRGGGASGAAALLGLIAVAAFRLAPRRRR